MAIIRRFSTIRQGGIVFTGNTAGLSPVNATGGQIAGSIAVFTSLNTALQVAGYPAVTDVPAPPANVCECTPFARANFGSCRRVCCRCRF